MNTTRINKNSVQDRVSRMVVGDYTYVETTVRDYSQVMRAWNPPSTRRHESIKGFKMKCSVYQAIKVSELANPIILVKVERIA